MIYKKKRRAEQSMYAERETEGMYSQAWSGKEKEAGKERVSIWRSCTQECIYLLSKQPRKKHKKNANVLEKKTQKKGKNKTRNGVSIINKKNRAKIGQDGKKLPMMRHGRPNESLRTVNENVQLTRSLTTRVLPAWANSYG